MKRRTNPAKAIPKKPRMLSYDEMDPFDAENARKEDQAWLAVVDKVLAEDSEWKSKNHQKPKRKR